MPVQRRIKYHNQPAGTGGTGPGANPNLTWGPDYGEPGGGDDTTWNTGVNLDMPNIDIANTDTVGANITMPTISLANTDGIGANLDLDSVTLANTDTVGANLRMPTLAMVNTDTVGANITMPKIALANSDSVGSKLTGSVLAAPFYQSSSFGVTSLATDTSLVINAPSGTSDGDFLIAHIARNYTTLVGATITPPSGWTLLLTNSSGAMDSWVYYKFAGASEPSSYTWTLGATGTVAQSCGGDIHRITAVDTSTPIDVSATAALGVATGDADPDSPSVTTTVANTMVFAFLAHDHGAVSHTHTPDTGQEEKQDYNSTASTGDFLGMHTMIKVYSATGATGTAEHNCTQITGAQAKMNRVAIRPTSLVIAS